MRFLLPAGLALLAAGCGSAAGAADDPPPPARAPAPTAIIVAVYDGDGARAAGDLAEAATEADALIRRVSGGARGLRGLDAGAVDVLGPVKVARVGGSDCPDEALATRALAALDRPVARYEDVVLHFPSDGRCDYGGFADGAHGRGERVTAFLNGNSSGPVLAHELLHNLALGHANRLRCTRAGKPAALSATCSVQAYGDPYDVMGHGTGLGAWHRQLAGWLPAAAIARVARSGRVTLRPLAGGAGVRMARVEIAPGLPPLTVEHDGARGLLVRQLAEGTNEPNTNTLDPALVDATPGADGGEHLRPDRPLIDRDHGLRLTVERLSASDAVLRVEILPDAGRPTRPGEPRAGLAPDATMIVSWRPSRDDRGVVRYQVRRDGRLLGELQAGPDTLFTDPRPGPGAHVYAITALDAVGKRSRPALARAGAAPPSRGWLHLQAWRAPGLVEGSLVSEHRTATCRYRAGSGAWKGCSLRDGGGRLRLQVAGNGPVSVTVEAVDVAGRRERLVVRVTP